MTVYRHDPFRPNTLQEYVGQDRLKERLYVHIDSAVARHDRLPHMLFVAPPGQGKTTLAGLLAAEVGRPFIAQIMPIESRMLHSLMRSFKGVCFFDEIHRMKDQEVMLSILQDGYMQDKNGQRTYNHDITFIGATTEGDKVIGPFYERFMVPPFDEYTMDQLVAMVTGMAAKIGVALDDDTIRSLAAACGGSPRMAGHLVTTARDLSISFDAEPSADQVLKMCGITPSGLTEEHVRYLTTLHALGGTAGLSLIGNHMRIPPARLMTLERLLVEQDLLTYSRSGRTLTMTGSTFVQEEVLT